MKAKAPERSIPIGAFQLLDRLLRLTEADQDKSDRVMFAACRLRKRMRHRFQDFGGHRISDRRMSGE